MSLSKNTNRGKAGSGDVASTSKKVKSKAGAKAIPQSSRKKKVSDSVLQVEVNALESVHPAVDVGAPNLEVGPSTVSSKLDVLRRHRESFLLLLKSHKASIKTFMLWFLPWCVPASAILLYNLSPASREMMIHAVVNFPVRIVFVWTVCVPLTLFLLWAAVEESSEFFGFFLFMVVATFFIYNSTPIYTAWGTDTANRKDEFVFDHKPHQDAMWRRKLAEERLIVEAEFRRRFFDALTGDHNLSPNMGLREAVDFCKGKSFRIVSARQRMYGNTHAHRGTTLFNDDEIDGVIEIDGVEYKYHAELHLRQGKPLEISSLRVFFH